MTNMILLNKEDKLIKLTYKVRQLTEGILTAVTILNGINKLLTTNGYNKDSSTRHQLAIAISILLYCKKNDEDEIKK